MKSAGDLLNKQEPWSTAFAKASTELKKIGLPVLVIVDDIDRLQTEELLALLKVVRLLGRFPGVHYLLAYDEHTIQRALSRAHLVGNDDTAARQYMEKIVQYPLVVPPLLQTQLVNRLNRGIEAVFQETHRVSDPGGRVSDLLNVFRSLLTTPRAIDRFLAQLRHRLPLVPQEEIDDQDVLVLTLLLTAFPTVYQELPRWRNELIAGHTGQLRTSGRRSGVGITDDDWERLDLPSTLLRRIPQSAHADAMTLLTDLFPKLHDRSDNQVRLFRNATRSPRRICSAEYFDRYFAMGVPAHDVSNAAVLEALSATVSLADHERLRGLLTAADAGRAELAILKAVESSGRVVSNEEDRHQVLRAVLPVIDSVIDQSTILFSPRRRVCLWISVVLAEMQSSEAAYVGELLHLTPRVTTRLELVMGVDAPHPPWWSEVLVTLTKEVVPILVEHVRQGDWPTSDLDLRYIIAFLMMDDVDAQLVRTALASELAASTISAADLAARFVYVDALTGNLGFNSDQFEKLAPAVASDTWNEGTVGEMAAGDTSWPNRRLFAVAHLRSAIANDVGPVE